MKDPVRLLDGGATHAELALLRAGTAEQPSDMARQRLLAALGLPLAASSSGLPSGSDGASSATLASAGGKLGVSWLVALGGSVVLGVAAIAYRAVEPADRAPVPIAAPAPAPAAAPSAPALLQPAAASSARPDRASQAEPTGAAREQSARARPVSKSIAREITRLDEVRGLLGRGESRAALAALDRYGAQHPAGVLRQEATLLRIEALASAGERASAQRLAERFLRDNPSSPHARRIRALAGGSADAP